MVNNGLETEKLFSYGTLRFPRFQREAFGRVISGEKAVAVGYKRGERIIDGESYPIIFESNHSRVEGLLLLLTPRELANADRYEDALYKRKKVMLKDGSFAWAYVYVKPAPKSARSRIIHSKFLRIPE